MFLRANTSKYWLFPVKKYQIFHGYGSGWWHFALIIEKVREISSSCFPFLNSIFYNGFIVLSPFSGIRFWVDCFRLSGNFQVSNCRNRYGFIWKKLEHLKYKSFYLKFLFRWNSGCGFVFPWLIISGLFKYIPDNIESKTHSHKNVSPTHPEFAQFV